MINSPYLDNEGTGAVLVAATGGVEAGGWSPASLLIAAVASCVVL